MFYTRPPYAVSQRRFIAGEFTLPLGLISKEIKALPVSQISGFSLPATYSVREI